MEQSNLLTMMLKHLMEVHSIYYHLASLLYTLEPILILLTMLAGIYAMYIRMWHITLLSAVFNTCSMCKY